jgi:hypothetical protein
MTHRSDVVLIGGWLLDADDLHRKDRVPEGWEHGLLLVLKAENVPYSFFLSVVEPDAEHGRPRYFSGWVHSEVLLDHRRYRRGDTGDVEPFADLVEARAGLRRAYRAVAGADDFEAAWKRGVALFKAMKKERRL